MSDKTQSPKPELPFTPIPVPVTGRTGPQPTGY